MEIGAIEDVSFENPCRPHAHSLNYYCYRTNTLWLGGASRKDMTYGSIAMHEIGHYLFHASTPYGYFLSRLNDIENGLVREYCDGFLKKSGLETIYFPIYYFAKEWKKRNIDRKESQFHKEIKNLIESNIKPWSRFRYLFEVMEGTGWVDINISKKREQEFLNFSPIKAIDYLLEFEEIDKSVSPVKHSKTYPPQSYPKINAQNNVRSLPLCKDNYGNYSAYGAHEILESTSQQLERNSVITKDGIENKMEYWRLWLVINSVFNDYDSSREIKKRLLITFLAICDLSLFTPIGALYGQLRTDNMDWTDIHPGFRFQKALKASSSIGLLNDTESETFKEYQKCICDKLGWPSPEKFFFLGLLIDDNRSTYFVHSCAMSKRFTDSSFYLRFLLDELSVKENKEVFPSSLYLPLIKVERTGKLLIQQNNTDVRLPIRQMLGCFLPQFFQNAMMYDKLNCNKILPPDFKILEPASNQYKYKAELMKLINGTFPWTQSKYFTHINEIY